MTEPAVPLLSTIRQGGPEAFDALWEAPQEWIETPNQRRGGWSGAARVKVRADDGSDLPCILKKQENHPYYSLRNGLIPRPTLEREARNLRYLREAGISVPDVLYYGRRKRRRRDQALLLIPELVGYTSLTDLLKSSATAAAHNTPASRRSISAAIGAFAHRLHRKVGWHHQNFYPKHLFLKFEADRIEVCMIDLENARPLRNQRQVVSDLGPLHRRTKGATLFERVAFMRSYCQCDRLGPAERALMRRIAQSK